MGRWVSREDIGSVCIWEGEPVRDKKGVAVLHRSPPLLDEIAPETFEALFGFVLECGECIPVHCLDGREYEEVTI